MLVKTTGVEETIAYLRKIGDEYPKEFIARATHDMHDKAIKNASRHTDTGRLENNISIRVKKLTGEVYIDNAGMVKRWKGKSINYGVFVHFGSRPHDIRPKNKKELRWSGHGDVFSFAKSVKHPGYRGDPFMYDALDSTTKILNKIAREVANERL